MLKRYELEFNFGNNSDERMIQYREQLYKSAHHFATLKIGNAVKSENEKMREHSLVPEATC